MRNPDAGVRGDREGTPAPRSPGSPERTPGGEISEEFRAEIREFARRLPELTYYEVLGVAPDAQADEIRAAFFERSKQFHPDRYFGRELRGYESLLTEIFKRVAVAQEVLRDPELRAEYDRGLGAWRRDASASSAPGVRAEPDPTREIQASPEEPSSPPAKDRAREASKPPVSRPVPAARRGPSLRDRAGVRPPDFALRTLEARLRATRDRARALFLEGRDLVGQREWERAVEKLRLAAALDPREREYQDELSEALSRVRELRAGRLKRDAEALLAKLQPEAAIERLSELVELNPADHELCSRLAELYLEVRGDVRTALLFAKQAWSVEPDRSAYSLQLGRLLKVAGSREAARQQFERTLILDPQNTEAKAELRAV